MRILAFLAPVLVLTSAAMAVAAPSFRIYGRNDFAGGTLSADGSRAGISSASASAGTEIFDVSTGLPIFGFGSSGPIAIALSGDGSVAQISASGGLFEFRNGQATRALQLPVFVPIALSDDGGISIGTDISGVGSLAYRQSGGLNGTPEPLGDLVGGETRSLAHALSGDGAVVVGYGTSELGREAFRWEAGTMAGIGDLSGGAFASEARGISRDGSTIVGFGTTSLGREAFRYRNGVMEGLGGLPGADPGGSAAATSGDGAIVVGGAGDLPFIWDEANGMRDLRVVLTSLGLDIQRFQRQGFIIGPAIDISSDGKTIMGVSWDFGLPPSNSPIKLSIWIAVIPEPSTATLLALGLAALAGNRRGSNAASGSSTRARSNHAGIA